jgi:hypothetical protein
MACFLASMSQILTSCFIFFGLKFRLLAKAAQTNVLVAWIAKVVKKSHKSQKSASKSSLMSFYDVVWYLCSVKQKACPESGRSQQSLAGDMCFKKGI